MVTSIHQNDDESMNIKKGSRCQHISNPWYVFTYLVFTKYYFLDFILRFIHRHVIDTYHCLRWHHHLPQSNHLLRCHHPLRPSDDVDTVKTRPPLVSDPTSPLPPNRGALDDPSPCYHHFHNHYHHLDHHRTQRWRGLGMFFFFHTFFTNKFTDWTRFGRVHHYLRQWPLNHHHCHHHLSDRNDDVHGSDDDDQGRARWRGRRKMGSRRVSRALGTFFLLYRCTMPPFKPPPHLSPPQHTTSSPPQAHSCQQRWSTPHDTSPPSTLSKGRAAPLEGRAGGRPYARYLNEIWFKLKLLWWIIF